MLFWLEVSACCRVREGVNSRLGLNLSLNLTLTTPNQNLTCFGVWPVTSDVIVTCEEVAKNSLHILVLILTVRTCLR